MEDSLFILVRKSRVSKPLDVLSDLNALLRFIQMDQIMYYPSTRLLTVLDLLQRHERLSGRELAERLEVDTRTVRRYITMLQDMGLPIETDHGRYGGYRLGQGYKLPPMIFNNEEILALSLGVVLARELGVTSVVAAAEEAFAKMVRVMPQGLRQQVAMIQETLTIAPARPPQELPSEPFLLLSQAVYEQRCVWLKYAAWSGQPTERKLEPYGLVHIIGMWYVAGYCHLRQDLRTFRLDRVVEAKLMLQEFERPSDFDPFAYVEQSIAKTPSVWNAEVLLMTTVAEAREMIPLTMGVLTETAEGVLMRCASHDLDELAYRLLGLPCEWVIVSPAALQGALVRLGERAQAIAQRVHG